MICINTEYDYKYSIVRLKYDTQYTTKYTLYDLKESIRDVWYSVLFMMYTILANIAYNTDQSPDELKTILEIAIIISIYVIIIQLLSYNEIKNFVLYNKNVIEKRHHQKDIAESIFIAAMICRFLILLVKRI